MMCRSGRHDITSLWKAMLPSRLAALFICRLQYGGQTVRLRFSRDGDAVIEAVVSSKATGSITPFGGSSAGKCRGLDPRGRRHCCWHGTATLAKRPRSIMPVSVRSAGEVDDRHQPPPVSYLRMCGSSRLPLVTSFSVPTSVAFGTFVPLTLGFGGSTLM